MVIDSRAHDCKCIIQIRQSKEGLALQVSGCNIDWVERWCVIIEYSEEIIVIIKEVLLFLGQLRNRWSMRGRGDAKIGHGSEERRVR